jgi:hypothetical protein
MVCISFFSLKIIYHYKNKMVATEQVLKIVVILSALGVLLYILYDYNTRSRLKESEEFEETAMGSKAFSPSDPAAIMNAAVGEKTAEQPKDCYPRDRLTADDLLPKGAANSKWSQVNPAGQGDVKDQNFLNAGFHIGVNTIGSSLRNPNLQVRSEPPNPQLNVSPWNQTTIDPDLNRRPLEIGGDCE